MMATSSAAKPAEEDELTRRMKAISAENERLLNAIRACLNELAAAQDRRVEERLDRLERAVFGDKR